MQLTKHMYRQITIVNYNYIEEQLYERLKIICQD
jgi:hypothetical protein